MINGAFPMRGLSILLALAFVLTGPSLAGSSEAGTIGIGTFTYSGSPIVGTGSQTVIVAAR
jgi:hypothetical protein